MMSFNYSADYVFTKLKNALSSSAVLYGFEIVLKYANSCTPTVIVCRTYLFEYLGVCCLCVYGVWMSGWSRIVYVLVVV